MRKSLFESFLAVSLIIVPRLSDFVLRKINEALDRVDGDTTS